MARGIKKPKDYYKNIDKATADIRKALKANGYKLNVSKNKQTSGLYHVRIGTNNEKHYTHFEAVVKKMFACDTFLSEKSCAFTPNCVKRDDSGIHHYKRSIHFVPRSTAHFLNCLAADASPSPKPTPPMKKTPSNGSTAIAKRAITALQKQVDRLPAKPAPKLRKTQNFNQDSKTPATYTGDKSLKGYEKANVYNVPIKDISTNEQIFQNRSQAYSKATYNSILEDIRSGKFLIQVLDPILLYWNEKNNQLFVLSGHSRLAAFRAANKQKLKVGKIDFSKIPARIVKSSKVGLELAVRIARSSNNLATPEGLTDRVRYYWQLLKRTSRTDTNKQIKKLEKKNATLINALTYLNKTGKTFRALKALENGETASEKVIQNIAYFIGRAMKKFPFLTLRHENEMYDFLVGGAYGSKVKSVADWLKEVERLIIKNTPKGKDFAASKPLNFKNLSTRSNAENELEKQLKEAIAKLNRAEKARREKSAKVLELQSSEAKKGVKKTQKELFDQYMDLLKKQHQAVDVATRALRDLLLKRPSVIRSSSKELTLFA